MPLPLNIPAEHRPRVTAAILLFIILSAVGAWSLPLSTHARIGNNDATWHHWPTDSANRQTAEVIQRLIGGSHGVLAVHSRGSSPYEELVLWISDRDNPGQIDTHEITVLSHSRVLQTLRSHTLIEPKPDAMPLVFGDVIDPAFCHDWRTQRGMHSQVLGSGLSDVVFAVIEKDDKSAGLRIGLRWSGETSDGSDEANLLVDALCIGRATEE